jgi:hypothetical protein
MVPTVFLIWITARFEAFYSAYSKFLWGLSLSAPVCLSVLFFGENHVGLSLINLCLYRLMWLPFILVGMGISLMVARFDRAKRFASYALLRYSSRVPVGRYQSEVAHPQWATFRDRLVSQDPS